MGVDPTSVQCPKCDNRLDLQTDGSTVTVDIAHHGERVGQAVVRLQREIDAARLGVAMYLRLVVGSGLIRDEALLVLRDLEFRGEVKDFEQEPGNPGAVLVRLK